MKYIKRIFESDHYLSKAELDLLHYLEWNKSWVEFDFPKNRDVFHCFKYRLNSKCGIVILFTYSITSKSKSISLYFEDSKGVLGYLDNVMNPMRSRSSNSTISIIEWCISLGKNQKIIFEKIDKLPNENDVRESFSDITDMGPSIFDILYGLISHKFPEDEWDREVFTMTLGYIPGDVNCVVFLSTKGHDISNEEIYNCVEKLKFYGHEDLKCKIHKFEENITIVIR